MFETIYELCQYEDDFGQTYDDCTVALIGNRYLTIGFDSFEEDYYALTGYESDLAQTESGKRLMRKTVRGVHSSMVGGGNDMQQLNELDMNSLGFSILCNFTRCCGEERAKEAFALFTCMKTEIMAYRSLGTIEELKEQLPTEAQ